jgi:hypothetical protein
MNINGRCRHVKVNEHVDILIQMEDVDNIEDLVDLFFYILHYFTDYFVVDLHHRCHSVCWPHTAYFW